MEVYSGQWCQSGDFDDMEFKPTDLPLFMHARVERYIDQSMKVPHGRH